MIIYKVLNKINGKIYVGQTAKGLEHRIAEHICWAKNGGSGGSLLHRAIRKYGVQSFEFSIVDLVLFREIASEKEKYWIKYFNSKVPNGYNLTDGGEGHKGFHASVETCRKLSLALTGEKHPMWGKHPTEETCRKISEAKRGKKQPNWAGEKSPHWGKHRSEETRMKLSKALMGWKHTEETRKKMSEAHSGEKNPMFGKISAFRGKQHTVETRRKMSDTQRRRLASSYPIEEREENNNAKSKNS